MKSKLVIMFGVWWLVSCASVKNNILLLPPSQSEAKHSLDSAIVDEITVSKAIMRLSEKRGVRLNINRLPTKILDEPEASINENEQYAEKLIRNNELRKLNASLYPRGYFLFRNRDELPTLWKIEKRYQPPADGVFVIPVLSVLHHPFVETWVDTGQGLVFANEEDRDFGTSKDTDEQASKLAEALFTKKELSLQEIQRVAFLFNFKAYRNAVSECGVRDVNDMNSRIGLWASHTVSYINQTYSDIQTASAAKYAATVVHSLLETPEFTSCPWALLFMSPSGINFEGAYAGSKPAALFNLAYLGKVLDSDTNGKGIPDIVESFRNHWEFISHASKKEILRYWADVGTKSSHWGRVQQFTRTLTRGVAPEVQRFYAKRAIEYGIQTQDALDLIPYETRMNGTQIVDVKLEDFSPSGEYTVKKEYGFKFNADTKDLSVPLESYVRRYDTCSTPVFAGDEGWLRICPASEGTKKTFESVAPQ